MRLGILGGTFNPVHQGHLMVAEQIREDFQLELVLFIPSAVPPHKHRPPESPRHRLAMVRLAVEGNPFFAASDLEVTRGGNSWSVDTLRDLRRLHPSATLFFIIGADAFREVSSWREAPALFGLADFILAARPGPAGGDPLRHLPPGVTPTGTWEEGPGGRRCPLSGGGFLHLSRATSTEVSSSQIRERVRQGRTIRYLVPDAVREYILREGLYRNPPRKEHP